MENVHDFLPYDAHGMAGAQLQRVPGHRKVHLGSVASAGIDDGAFELLDF
jgi:hypothetical protein